MKIYAFRIRMLSNWPLLILGAITLYTLWVLLAPATVARSQFAVWLSVFVGLAGSLAATIYLNNLRDRDIFRSWRLIVITMWIWTAAVSIEAFVWIITSAPITAPSIANLLELAGYLAAFTALVLYPIFQPERFGRLREALDMTILIIAVAALAWLVLIEPVINIGVILPHRTFWLAMPPVFDGILLLLVIRLALLVSHSAEQRAFLILAGGFTFLLLSDLGSSYQILQRESVGGGLSESAWMLCMTGMGFSLHSLSLSLDKKDEAMEKVTNQSRRLRAEQLLPIVFTYAVVGFILVDWWVSGAINWVGIGWAAVLILLLFARQGVIAGQREMRQYAALINATADLAFICDADGVLQLTNPALQEAVGEREVLRLDNFLHIDQGVSDVLDRANREGWSGEVSVVRTGGLTFPALLSLQPLRDMRQTQPLLAGTAHDLTTIRQRENDLRLALTEIEAARLDLAELNQELETKVVERTRELEKTVADLERLNEDLKALDRLKTEFVALVSHELRAPLTNIKGGIELILDRSPETAASENESLRLVQAETARLAKFVEMILDLSALEAGKFHLEIQPLSLTEVVARVRNRFPEDEHVSRIRVAIPEGLPQVLADNGGLESICFHLLDNALKYAPDGDIVIAADVENSTIIVSVCDEGPGIPNDEQVKVFDMFHRLDTTDSREIYGYGLGLPMVERLIHAMDGDVLIERQTGGGTRVQFTLPSADEV
jgi:PAS domain S-box-containing protein